MKSYQAMGRAFFLAMTLIIPTATLFAQYNTGDVVRADDLNKQFTYCSNETGTSTLGDLLSSSAGGTPTRALWINFFASW